MYIRGHGAHEDLASPQCGLWEEHEASPACLRVNDDGSVPKTIIRKDLYARMSHECIGLLLPHDQGQRARAARGCSQSGQEHCATSPSQWGMTMTP